MVFGIQKLQDQVFCLTEERDFFQAKYLEQVSELQSLKEELRSAKKEISKLRGELMQGSALHIDTSDLPLSPDTPNQHDADQEDNSTLTSEGDENEPEEEDKEAKDIRQSAEKLLQWASYRSSVNTSRTSAMSTPDHSSVASPNSFARQSLLGNIPQTIHNEDDNESTTSSVDSPTTPRMLRSQMDHLVITS